MIARRHIRMAVLIGCVLLLLALSLELLRRSKPDIMSDDTEMLYPEVISGVWVTGFEESSFFPGATSIPDPNDDRRFRLVLIVDPGWANEMTAKHNRSGASQAFRITFVGRRTKYPLNIDCDGGRDYFFVPDLVLAVHDLGVMAPPDLSARSVGPYKSFKPSGESGVIGDLESRALARCGGSQSVRHGTR